MVGTVSERWTVTYRLGPGREAVLDVPSDMTADEEATLRRMIEGRAFGSFVERIAKGRERHATPMRTYREIANEAGARAAAIRVQIERGKWD